MSEQEIAALVRDGWRQVSRKKCVVKKGETYLRLRMDEFKRFRVLAKEVRP